MTVTENSALETLAPPAAHQGKHWIHDWRPEDPEFWSTTGKPIARKNLIFSIFAEHIGFSVWLLWSIVVVQMTAGGAGGAPAASGFALTTTQALCWWRCQVAWERCCGCRTPSRCRSSAAVTGLWSRRSCC